MADKKVSKLTDLVDFIDEQVDLGNLVGARLRIFGQGFSWSFPFFWLNELGNYGFNSFGKVYSGLDTDDRISGLEEHKSSIVDVLNKNLIHPEYGEIFEIPSNSNSIIIANNKGYGRYLTLDHNLSLSLRFRKHLFDLKIGNWCKFPYDKIMKSKPLKKGKLLMYTKS